jgi:hypothetical protein
VRFAISPLMELHMFVDMPFEGHADLAGRGLLFVPSAFTWPRPSASPARSPTGDALSGVQES